MEEVKATEEVKTEREAKKPKKEIAYVNEFVARGIVLSVQKTTNYGYPILDLYVKERRKELHLSIQLEKGAYPKNLHKKDRVIVTGYIRGFNYHDDITQQDKQVTYFVATHVEKSQTELEQRFGKGVHGIFYPEHVFRAFVLGVVRNVRYPAPGKTTATLTVQTKSGGSDARASFIPVQYYTAGQWLPAFDFKENDVICMRLSGYTPEVTRKNRTFHYQNLSIEDFDYLQKVPREEDNAEPVPLNVDLGLKANLGEIDFASFFAKEAETEE